MAEQWISAFDAYSIVKDQYAICERLYAGLITAKATRYFRDDKYKDDFLISEKFWWAKGHAALDQNWETGDFSTQLPPECHVRAFGVTFELAGILEMLPIERRAMVARSFSVAGNATSMSANAAVEFVQERAGIDLAEASQRLLDQASLGFMAARAVLARKSKSSSQPDNWEWERREWDVPTDFWNDTKSTESFMIDLENSRFSAPNCVSVHGKFLSLSGVYFLRGCVEGVWPQHLATSNPVPPKPSGGRPPTAFNDDLMCAIWTLIYEGDLEPKTQADVERAILDWITHKGHDLSESTIRDKARKIWSSVSTKGKKPPR